MDKQLIERIVVESALEWGLDPDASLVDFVSNFCLARIDAKRGKEAVALVVDDFDGWTKVRMLKPQPSGTKLFLSPTIPEGMALVPVEPTAKMIAAAVSTFPCSQAETFRTMLAAAQGERNAD